MRFNKLKISTDATSRLRALRQRTGLTPNLLCRAAVMLSLEEGAVGKIARPDENGQEFNAYTLTGDYNDLFGALLRYVEETEAGLADPLDNDELLARFRSHIHRGVATLSVRAKSPADISRLAMAL